MRLARQLHSRGSHVLMAIILAAYIATFAFALWQGVRHPYKNPDMLAYVAAAISFDSNDPQEIYDRTMKEMRKVLEANEYRYYSEGIPVFANKDMLYQWLPIDLCKPLYVRTVWALHKLGVGLAKATWLTSAWSFAALGIVCFCWRPSPGRRMLWLLAIVLLCRLGDMPLSSLAQYSTPDALALALFMSAFFAWMIWQSALFFVVGSLLSILARPDALPLVCMLGVYFSFFPQNGHKLKPWIAALVIFGGAACFFGVQIFVKGSDLTSLLYHGFISNTGDSKEGALHISLDQYMGHMLYQGMRDASLNAQARSFFVLSLLSILACSVQRSKAQRPWFWLLLMTWATLFARFCAFPTWEPRYYYAYYLLMVISCLEILYPQAMMLWNKTSINRANRLETKH